MHLHRTSLAHLDRHVGHTTKLAVPRLKPSSNDRDATYPCEHTAPQVKGGLIITCTDKAHQGIAAALFQEKLIHGQGTTLASKSKICVRAAFSQCDLAQPKQLHSPPKGEHWSSSHPVSPWAEHGHERVFFLLLGKLLNQ